MILCKNGILLIVYNPAALLHNKSTLFVKKNVLLVVEVHNFANPVDLKPVATLLKT